MKAKHGDDVLRLTQGRPDDAQKLVKLYAKI